MIQFIRRIAVSCVAICAIVASSAVLANNFGAADELYGQGVQAFYDGRLMEANLLLCQAIAANELDPRFYYFRALSLLRMGNVDQARDDMRIGARLEARTQGRFAIGTALERVQGHDRLMLEAYRRQARANAPVAGVAAGPIASPPATDTDINVRRQRQSVPLDEFLRQGQPRATAAAETPAPLPAAGSPPKPSAPAAEPTTAEADPFGDDAKQAAAPPVPPATPPPAPQKAAPPAAIPPQPPKAEAPPKEAPANETDPFSGF
jgi:hypothetical protein